MTTDKDQQKGGNQPKQPQLAKRVVVLIEGSGTIRVDAPANIDEKFQTGSFTVRHGASVTIKAIKGKVQHFVVNDDDIQRGQQWSETIKADTVVKVVFDENAEAEKPKVLEAKETQVIVRTEGKGSVSFVAEGVDDFAIGESVTLNKGQEFTLIAEPVNKYRLKRMQVGARVISGRTTVKFTAEGETMTITVVFDKKAPAHDHADHGDEHEGFWSWMSGKMPWNKKSGTSEHAPQGHVAAIPNWLGFLGLMVLLTIALIGYLHQTGPGKELADKADAQQTQERCLSAYEKDRVVLGGCDIKPAPSVNESRSRALQGNHSSCPAIEVNGYTVYDGLTRKGCTITVAGGKGPSGNPAQVMLKGTFKVTTLNEHPMAAFINVDCKDYRYGGSPATFVGIGGANAHQCVILAKPGDAPETATIVATAT